MKIRNSIIVAIAVAIVLMVSAAQAFNPQPEPPGSLPAGLNPDETATIYAVYVPGSDVSGIEPVPFIPISLAFFNANGQQIAQSSTRVGLGRVVSLELNERDADHRVIYGVVQCRGAVALRSLCAQAVKASMQISDSDSGQTRAVVPIVLAVQQVLEGNGDR